MKTDIRTMETTEGLYINLTDLLTLLKRVYRTTADLTVMKVYQALKGGTIQDGEIDIR